MRFCTNCGNKLDDNAQFCTACGTAQPATHDTANNGGNELANNSGTFAGRTPSASGITPAIPLPGSGVNGTPSAPVPAPATAPVPTPTSAPAGTAIAGAASATTTTVRQHTKKRLIIIIAAIVAAILVVTGAGFGTYKAELWGGKTVPAPADLGIAKSKKTHEFTAADVEKSLHAKGFKTTVTETFSAKPKGSFINYRGIQSGKRYSTGNNPVTILASNGPGVPKGTSGQPVQNVTENLESMGVSVHYYSIVVSEHGPKEGTVIASYPADGQPVRDTKTGIEVGVAKRDGGIGYDVLGMTKDKAKSQYASAGFNVTLKARFSSKKMLGKIVDSNPKPGSVASGGDLTLYYGIDASGMKDAVSMTSVYGPDSDWVQHASPSVREEAVGSAAPVAGTYCTKDGKCINLDEDNSDMPNGVPTVSSSEDPKDTSAVSIKNNNTLLFCAAMQQPNCQPKKGILYGNGAGAFQLLPYNEAYGYKCGDTDETNTGSGPAVCVNGNPNASVDTDNLPDMTGASYEMGLLYTYFPVGSDVKKVVGSGYFDKGSVAKAKKQKSVDTSRPFFIRRDKSLYKKTSVSISSLNDPNPFTPSFFPRDPDKAALEPVKPAPSDETAYYLVDQPQLDWSKLPEFTITKASKSDKKSGHKPNQKTKTKPAKDATPDEITAAVGKGDFSPIAGKYCKTDGSCLQLDKKGTVTGIPSDWKDQSSSQLHLAGPKEEWGDDARNSVPNSPYLSLIGPDSDYKCPAGTGEELCYNSGAIEADIQKPIYMMYVFKNVDTSFWYNGNNSYPSPGFAVGDDPDQPPAKDKPYLSFLSYHMNDSPRDHDVYYLTK
ncbi:PASTA domain-containing protein [Bifidobacterium sp. ESL0764]|uniref:PASTA domain-containing protein n=1 Tax=Bifidobacterium sp. ESL0764 TaxID=2983228 RepID=UPI0023F77651|nr:PASTA domain-containing protein [Bifidobacterium sp. ESL0764]WEV65782.1 PASTA domain-containing protein [Bifidobacterium sp. ESL0764]